MLRSKFDEELDKLHNQFYAMGIEAIGQIKKQFVLLSVMIES